MIVILHLRTTII